MISKEIRIADFDFEGIGAYVITLPNGPLYVGSTKSLKKRISEHLSTLQSGKGDNRKLQEAFNSIVEKDFVVQTLRFPTNTREEAFALEQKLIDFFSTNELTRDYLCNLRPCALGTRHSEDSIRLMSSVKRGFNRKGTNSKLTGRHRPQEVKDKVRFSHEKRTRPFLALGAKYSSLRNASRTLNIPRSTLRLWARKGVNGCRRIDSDNETY